jgi:hypothetical protein
MEARHAGSTATSTSGVQRASPFAVNEIVEESVERRLEHCLQATKDEITLRCGVDDECRVRWH